MRRSDSARRVRQLREISCKGSRQGHRCGATCARASAVDVSAGVSAAARGAMERKPRAAAQRRSCGAAWRRGGVGAAVAVGAHFCVANLDAHSGAARGTWLSARMAPAAGAAGGERVGGTHQGPPVRGRGGHPFREGVGGPLPPLAGREQQQQRRSFLLCACALSCVARGHAAARRRSAAQRWEERRPSRRRLAVSKRYCCERRRSSRATRCRRGVLRRTQTPFCSARSAPRKRPRRRQRAPLAPPRQRPRFV